ncbi:DUF4440 domain-containing protein [Paenibacillus donghaensis]|jgi:hypothetical protein|uniref:DUF4440 domain-containing protein n=1 Tax=Paenibacillus donghaensis TaxID=414771 RepID=UPI001883FB27|nr:DUF4440 domain-containing protein [Paenibacillus donghaensis]MBE9915825.1 DUF4440 domain-containing protein [Paenibacillus donghaensis]
MLEEAIAAVEEYRRVINKGNVEEVNTWISDEFIGYFGYYPDRDYEIYRSEHYKTDNIETFAAYEGKQPHWEYKDLARNMRTDNELIISAIVDFSLHGKKVASVLAMEVYRKEKGAWKLYRQHMEKYAEV